MYRFLVGVALFVAADTAIAATCPSPLPDGMVCVRKGAPLEWDLSNSPPAAIHWLVMEDSSSIIVSELAGWDVVINKASFGKDTRIALQGYEGGGGALGASHPAQAAYCANGTGGGGGGEGGTGGDSPYLRLMIAEFSTAPESLTIELNPGHGGVGGTGGAGQKGGDANCLCDGGNGGTGGTPGAGGDAGQVGRVEVWVPYLPTAISANDETASPEAAADGGLKNLPNPCGPSGLCVPDVTTGFQNNKAVLDLLGRYEKFGFSLTPPMGLTPPLSGIYFKCNGGACDPGAKWNNGGHGGYPGEAAAGGRGNCRGYFPETCGAYCKGAGGNGYQPVGRGAEGRPSSGPLPIVLVTPRGGS